MKPATARPPAEALSAAPPVYDLPAPDQAFEWSFFYAGPREPAPDLSRCFTCLAQVQKRCPTHDVHATSNCAHCKAAAGGACHGHWGLVAALDYREKQLESGGLVVRSDYALARALVLAEPPHPVRKNVQVSLRGSGNLALTGERTLVVEIKTL
jgi:hypothetical protein